MEGEKMEEQDWCRRKSRSHRPVHGLLYAAPFRGPSDGEHDMALDLESKERAVDGSVESDAVV